MRGLTHQQNRRRTSSCSFCRSEDHQVSQCPHVIPVWRELSKGIIPLALLSELSNSSDGYSPFRYFQQGSEWGNLFKHTEKAAQKVQAFQERQRQKAQSGNKKRAPRVQTCGYCGETGHTRRTCGHLASDTTKLTKANRNFREWVYEVLVKGQGLSTGAIIQFDGTQAETYRATGFSKQVTTLVTDVNWDTMNVFSTMPPSNHGWNYARSVGVGQERLENVINFFKSYVLVKTAGKQWADLGFNIRNGYGATDAQSVGVSLPVWTEQRSSNPLLDYDNQSRLSYNCPNVTGYRVISPAPQVLSEDWKDGYSDAMSVIFKKFSRNELKAVGVLDHLDDWQTSKLSQ